MAEEERRSAERVELREPIQAMVGDVPARITEISLINCRLEHTGKLPMASNITLQFDWSGERIRLKGKLTRSEMRPIGGKLAYVSAMQLSDSIEAAPAALRRLIAHFLGAPEAPKEPPKPPPPPAPTAPPKIEEGVELIEPEAELPAIRYVQCSLVEGTWSVKEVTEPRQPREGFTMIAPDNPAEIDQFCKTYEVADPETRRMIRLSFELAIAQVNG